MFENTLLALSDFLNSYGYISLFIVSFMGGSVIPLGVPEPLIIAMYQTHNIFLIILVATVGNTLGSFPTYILGKMGIRKLFNKFEIVSPQGLEKAHKRFEKYGAWSLLFTSVPFIGHAIAFAAGTVKYDLKPFTILVTAGNLARFVLVVLLLHLGYNLSSVISF
jgi:membrane protein YqaA with SNARE-associated domain